MKELLRRTWRPTLKIACAATILTFLGMRFGKDLTRIDFSQHSLNPFWMLLSGGLYLAGLLFSAAYWIRLLSHLRQPNPILPCLRAYYLGHLGKYPPGKAWALILRTTLSRGFGVPLSIGVMTSFYEVLVTMAAGATVAGLVFGSDWQWAPRLDWVALRSLLFGDALEGEPIDSTLLLIMALSLLAITLLPVAPPVFNRLVYRIARPFRKHDGVALPVARWSYLVEGIPLTACGWLVLGLSLWALMQTTCSNPPTLSVGLWLWYSALLGFSYVVGFVVVVSPGGLGVREYFLLLFLVPEASRLLLTDLALARGEATLTVILLRIIWTASEVAAVGFLYLIPTSRPRDRVA